MYDKTGCSQAVLEITMLQGGTLHVRLAVID